MVMQVTGVQPRVGVLHSYTGNAGEPARRDPAGTPPGPRAPPPRRAVPAARLPRMSSEKLPSWKAEGDSSRRPRSRDSYTRCSPAEYMSTSRRAGPPAPPATSQWSTRWRSCNRSWVHTMRGLWQRSTARAPAVQLTTDSDTTELPACPDPEGPGGERVSARAGQG